MDFAAGRGYDRQEYVPFGVSFEDNQSIFEEGMEVVRRRWSWRRHRSRIAAGTTHRQRGDHAAAGAVADPGLCRVVLQAVDRACGASGVRLIVAPFAAAMTFGGLREVHDLYHETCATHGTAPGRLMCSYFTHFADDDAQAAGGAGAADPGTTRNASSPPSRGDPADRAAELSLLHRDGGAAAHCAAGRLVRELACRRARRRTSPTC